MAHESEIAKESDEDLAMIEWKFKKSFNGKKSDRGFKGANSKGMKQAERYSSSDESEDEFEAESVGYNDLKDTFDKLYKMNIKVQKSNSSLSTIVKSLEGERDDAIKELKETNSKQEKEITDCMERM
ncbi:hypothetical protein ACOSQ3_004841 [Xanthoceras sorbifolium]